MSEKKQNPMENSVIQKAALLIVAVVVSISVPLLASKGIIRFDEKEASAPSVSKVSQVSEQSEVTPDAGYYMADLSELQNVDYFAKGTIEHIFDGTINKKGNATGYHYTMIVDSKGSVIDGTRSKEDKNGVFTANVEVNGVKKNGFSSFYPESWTPQQVVDAINAAYEEAIANPDNPSGSLWIGHYKDIEIDMYLDSNQKITTAYPVYAE